MQFAPQQLDSATRDYLRSIHTNHGRHFKGVYVPMKAGASAAPASLWWLMVLAGVGIALVGALTIRPSALDDPSGVGKAGLQAFCAGVALFLLAWGIIQYLQPNGDETWPTFIAIDGRYLWQVTNELIDVHDLHHLEHLRCQPLSAGGILVGAEAEFEFAEQTLRLHIPDAGPGTRFTTFAEHLVSLLQATEPDVRESVRASAARAAAWAHHRTVYGNMTRFAGQNVGAEPPTPTFLPTPATPSAPPYAGALAAGAVGVIAAVLVYVVAPMFNRPLIEQAIYDAIPTRDTGDVAKLDRYLELYPTGKYATAVRELRDDRRFAFTEQLAKTERDPGPYRRYLADADNQRHRAAAQTGIDFIYDQAIADLQLRANKHRNFVDGRLLKAVVQLIHSLKQAPSPEVTVALVGTHHAEPEGPVKAAEQAMYEAMLKANPQLQKIARSAPNRSALVPVAEAFDAKQTERRERVIFGRLEKAVRGGMPADLMKLKPVPAGTSAMLEVHYQIQPAGKVTYYYVADPERRTRTYLGVLREYEVQWLIKVKPIGVEVPMAIQ
jgi:hypothetical protein